MTKRQAAGPTGRSNGKMVARMSINAIGAGSAVSWSVPPAGASVDPETQRAQVRAQADMLSALRGVGHTGLTAIAAARLTDGQGIDLYV